MVPPSGLADIVTPPIFSPDEEITAPLSITSSARPLVGTSAVATIASPAAMNCQRVMTFLPSLLAPGISFQWRVRLQVSDNRVGLVRAKIIFEAGHARRAVADDLANDLGASAKGLPRERRRVKAARQRRFGMADDAGLLEQAPAKSLSVAEAIVGCGSLCAQRRAEDERESCEGAPHLQLSRM